MQEVRSKMEMEMEMGSSCRDCVSLILPAAYTNYLTDCQSQQSAQLQPQSGNFVA